MISIQAETGTDNRAASLPCLFPNLTGARAGAGAAAGRRWQKYLAEAKRKAAVSMNEGGGIGEANFSLDYFNNQVSFSPTSRKVLDGSGKVGMFN